MTPYISVIMSVYNGEKYIKESVESILNQTYSNFEFIVTDDCSTDNSWNILLEYSRTDSRIRLFKNEFNIGLTKTLNKMLEVAKGEFVARMDVDDISLPLRFERQISYMLEHPEVGVCGTNTSLINEGKKANLGRFIFDPDEIRAAMLFQNAMPHSAVMMRAQLFNKNNIRYNEKFYIIQDYELWQRLVCVTQFKVLEEVLFKYRVVDNGITSKSSKIENYREGFLYPIYKMGLNRIGINPSNHELKLHYLISNNYIVDCYKTYKECENWLCKIIENNKVCNKCENEAMLKIVSSYWYSLSTRASSVGLKIIEDYHKSKIYNNENISFINTLKLILKCSIKYKNKNMEKFTLDTLH